VFGHWTSTIFLLFYLQAFSKHDTANTSFVNREQAVEKLYFSAKDRFLPTQE